MVDRGLQKAIDMTIRIANALPNKQNGSLYTKSVHIIFDEQLKRHTTLNRFQRHKARKQLKEALKNHE